MTILTITAHDDTWPDRIEHGAEGIREWLEAAGVVGVVTIVGRRVTVAGADLDALGDWLLTHQRTWVATVSPRTARRWPRRHTQGDARRIGYGSDRYRSEAISTVDRRACPYDSVPCQPGDRCAPCATLLRRALSAW